MLLGYIRVSTTEQAAADRTSLETQEQIARGYAQMMGFTKFDLQVYVDAGVSGACPLHQRPAGEKLLADARSGDTVFAAKLDRMFRSAKDALNVAEKWKEQGVKLVLQNLGNEPVNMDGGMAHFFFTIMAACATLERDTIRGRMLEGKAAKRLKGGHAGGSAPYGWKIVGAGREARLEINTDEQRVLEIVKTTRQTYGHLFSPLRMVNGLEKQGLRSRSGKTFKPLQIERMVEQIQRAS
jgi:putative DNA-invertase from lambdoid prophage Rac